MPNENTFEQGRSERHLRPEILLSTVTRRSGGLATNLSNEPTHLIIGFPLLFDGIPLPVFFEMFTLFKHAPKYNAEMGSRDGRCNGDGRVIRFRFVSVVTAVEESFIHGTPTDGSSPNLQILISFIQN